MPEYIYHLTTTVTAPAASDDPADFPAQYAADKERIKNSFPNVDGPVTTTDTELELLSGLTATATELNQLDGVVPVITTTTQTIGGAKTFSTTPVTSNTQPEWRLTDSNGTSGEQNGAYMFDNDAFQFVTYTDAWVYDDTPLTVQADGSGLTYFSDAIFHAGNLLDEDTMSSDSAVLPASQQSIKAYVDTAIAAVGGGVVQQIKVATSSPASSLDATYATKETVSLTSVASGSYVVVFALGIYTVSSQIISQKITNSSGTIKSVGESSTHATSISNASLVSIAYDTTPGTGTVTYWLQAKEATNVSGTIDHAIMVAVEYTP